MTTKKKDKILVGFILVCALLPNQGSYAAQLISIFIAVIAGYLIKEAQND